MKFYILMIDYGTGPKQPMGLEAVVQPELTRRAIIEQAREILNSDDRCLFFVKFVDGDSIEDVTTEIIEEAFDREEA